jgi:hypothetical protein
MFVFRHTSCKYSWVLYSVSLLLGICIKLSLSLIDYLYYQENDHGNSDLPNTNNRLHFILLRVLRKRS